MAIDEKSQKLGFVGIIYLVGQSWTVFRDRNEVWETSRLRVAMPLRMASGHMCFDDIRVKKFMALAVMVHGRSMSRTFGEVGTFVLKPADEKTRQIRSCSEVFPTSGTHVLSSSQSFVWNSSLFYTGSHVEVQYKLMSYGIPAGALPVDGTGGFQPETWSHWLPQQRTLEASGGNTTISIATAGASALAKLSPSYIPQPPAIDIEIPGKECVQSSKSGIITEPGRFDVVSAMQMSGFRRLLLETVCIN